MQLTTKLQSNRRPTSTLNSAPALLETRVACEVEPLPTFPSTTSVAAVLPPSDVPDALTDSTGVLVGDKIVSLPFTIRSSAALCGALDQARDRFPCLRLGIRRHAHYCNIKPKRILGHGKITLSDPTTSARVMVSKTLRENK
jgi:hypothetical protein